MPSEEIQATCAYRRNLENGYTLARSIISARGGGAAARISRWVSLAAHARRRIAEAAGRLGYDRRCRRSIPVCRGECCDWHFPRKLTAADFVVMLWEMPRGQVHALEKRILAAGGVKMQCGLRASGGCIMSFERRPLICASAYPCFANSAYHRMTSETLHRLHPMMQDIEMMAARSEPGYL